MKKSTMGVKLDQETRERLKALGEIRERSPHWLMTDAIHRYLDVEERFEEEKREDEERWQRYLDSDAFVSEDEMTARLETLADRARQKAEAE